jgi:imidazolonepropionase-like amidohydrolase
MGVIRKVIAALVLTCASAGSAQPPAHTPTASATITYIHAGSLLDRPGQPPRGNSTIIVRDGRIVAIRDGFVAAETGATIVDLRDRFVMPGLIDLHVHLWGIGGDPIRERVTALNRDSADDIMYAVGNAKATLRAGFTTVRDLGADARGIRALRDAIERGDVEGPTIVNADQMISVTGGHGDGTNGLAAEFAETVHAHQINICDGADDCRRAVREQVSLGAEVIKFGATGGVLSNVSGGLGRAMLPEEMRAIVETAHALGRKVAAHSHAADGTKAALEAGVDTIEHGTFLDDEAIRLFKAKGAWLVPTEMARIVVEQGRAGLLPAAVIPKAEAAVAAGLVSHKKAIAAGVKIAFGTDSGVSKHGDNAGEFAFLVENGLTPAQALRTATLSAAEALGRDASIGSIAPGKDADIIAVAGDPLRDVRRMEHVDFVMRQGVVHKAGGHVRSPVDD